ncbi:NADH:flavin oxidoreductase, partial [Thermodesulfobacteriota bacterium]
MSVIFSPWQIKSVAIKNRLVRSATWEGAATPEGDVTDKLVQYYHDFSRGGLGLIISGYMYVRPDGIGLSYQTGISNDDQIGGLQQLTRAAHYEDTRVVCQIVHGGGQVSAHLLPKGAEPLAPSDHYYERFKTDAREMTADEINGIVVAFGDAAARAKAAGFDGVQLHSAHGYLINQFLSGHTNKRKDGYGGSLAGRFRFAKEVVRTVRARVGDAYPVGVKLNSQDFVEDGILLEEAVQFAEWYEQSGVDFIEVSGGVPEAGKMSPTRAVKK